MDNRQFISGSILVFVGLLFAKVVSLVIRMMVARLGTTESGVFYLSLYALKLALLVSFLGFEAFLVRDIADAFRRKDPAGIRSIIRGSVSLLIPVSLVVGGVLFFAAGVVADWFHEPGLVIPLRIVSLSVPFIVLLKVSTDSFRGLMRQGAFLVFEHFGKDALRLVFAVCAIMFVGSVSAILFSNLLVFMVVSVFAALFLRRLVWKRKIRGSARLIQWSDVFSFTLPIYGGVIAFASLEWIDSFMIGRMLSVSDVGVYDVAFSVAWCLLVFPTAMMTFLLPKVMRSMGDMRSMRLQYVRVVTWNLALNGLFAGVFIVFGESLLDILFGPVFVGGYVVLVVLSTGFWVAHSLLAARVFLYVNKRSNVLLFIAVCAALLSIVLNYFFIGLWGLVGAAIATAMSAGALSAGYVVATYADLGLLPFSDRMVISVAGFLAVLLGAVFFPESMRTAGLAVCLALYVLAHGLSGFWRKELSGLMGCLRGWTARMFGL
ncbi:oligosaccharide flippase family protein [Candidatus Woesearchaeota archaeon]|nr:oligosaccharide flippase family protein [Candidatus Woesearchaeota archaeon]